MKRRQKLLTDEQWELIEPLLPKAKRRADGCGRPPASNRTCFEGLLWILQTGAAWRFLPDEFPSPSTCWRRLQQWQEQGVWLAAWRALLGGLDEEGLLRWDETFLDGSFAPAKKGALAVARISPHVGFGAQHQAAELGKCTGNLSVRRRSAVVCGCED